MSPERKCAECGADISASQPEPICPACIFQRMSRLGFPVDTESQPPQFPPEEDSSGHDTDFYSDYELLGEIGRGGMGVIYKAHQPRLNRVVAVKVIHAAQIAGEGARRRFEAEMQLAGRLNHPNIVPVFDTGVMDGCPCFSMEYFPGG